MTSVPSSWQLLSQGAEAIIHTTTLLGVPVVVKQRPVKTYRHPILDKQLSRQRLTQEIRCLRRCRNVGVPTPAILFVNLESSQIFMERINGETVKSFLYSNPSKTKRINILQKIGKILATMHNHGVSHGDLTTSNIMLRDKFQICSSSNSLSSTSPVLLDNEIEKEIVLIDFGLGSNKTNAEDRAVDLYVLERAFASTHPNSKELFAEVMKSYETEASEKHWKSTKSRLEAVRARGRKRSCFG